VKNNNKFILKGIGSRCNVAPAFLCTDKNNFINQLQTDKVKSFVLLFTAILFFSFDIYFNE